MKVLIFLAWKPVITETFILSEFDLLKKASIDFFVYYIHHYLGIKKHPKIREYDNKITYIPKLPRPIFRKIIYILFYQSKLFFLHPIKYIKILAFVLLNYKRYLLRSFFRLSKFIPEIEKYNPDLIYCHYTYENAIFAFLTKLYFDKNQYGMITHQLNIYEPTCSNLNNIIAPEFIIVKAEYAKEIWMKRYAKLPIERIKVLPWGIDCKYFTRLDDNSDSNRKKIFTILSISRLVEQKGIIYLLKACYILAKNNLDFRCLIYGDGKEKYKLLRYIKQFNLGKYIKLYPFISHSVKIKKLLSSADIFVLPCLIAQDGEGDIIPNVLLEAMAMELPVVTTKAGGMNEVIKDGVNGFIVKEKDEVDIADKIVKIMKMSENTKSEIGKNARETVIKYWDKETLGKSFINFLNKVHQDNEEI